MDNAETPHRNSEAKSGHFIDDSDDGAISRISECELFSPIFGDGNYRVCISPNGRNARIWPDKYGQIASVNHVMTIGGLASKVPFESAGRVDLTKSKGRIDLRFREDEHGKLIFRFNDDIPDSSRYNPISARSHEPRQTQGDPSMGSGREVHPRGGIREEPSLQGETGQIRALSP